MQAAALSPCRPRGQLQATRRPAAAAWLALPRRQQQRCSAVAGGGREPRRRSPAPPLVQAVARPMGPVHPHQDDVAADGHPYSLQEQLQGYYRLLRGWNALPSAVLVLLGAWTGAGKTLLALKGLTVWFMAWASGAVALASCAINDYFDWRLDAVNDSSKPIPSGLIPPDRALLVASVLYIALLALACVVPNAGVRLIVAASSLFTLLYTPLLKRHTLVKNLVVASVIAAAPLAGALAAGAAGPGLRAVGPPCAFLWLGTMAREILMDIQDRRGDGAAGVQTLPVVLGPRAALAACLALLAACMALATHAALAGQGLAWAWAARPALEPGLRAAALAAVGWTLSKPAAAAVAVLRSGFGKEETSRAISVAMSSVGLGTLLLAVLA